MAEFVPGLPLVEGGKERLDRKPYAMEYDEEDNSFVVLDREVKCRDVRSPRAPNSEHFKHFTKDKTTLETVNHVAVCVSERMPCLLEGETATSKTSAIEYLASELGFEIERINVSGQMDTSELIGKFVPNDGQLQINFEQMLRHKERLSKPSQAILEEVQSANPPRGLDKFESQQIATNEGFEVPEWRWDDGPIAKAMKEGKWVILDELNLGDPSILERLNSVLEDNPQLTMSENGNQRIGANGDFEVHKDFRIFATMNPSTYAGRKALSPAYMDRWKPGYKFVKPPKEEDYLAMMRLMVYGEQPAIKYKETDDLGAMDFDGEKVDPMFNQLKNIEGLEVFLASLAKLQVNLIGAAKDRKKLGKDSNEDYVFTRRGILALFKKMEKMKIVNREGNLKTYTTLMDDPKKIIIRAMKEIFTDKMKSADDKRSLITFMEIGELTNDKWGPELSIKQPARKSIFEMLAEGEEIPDEVPVLDGGNATMSQEKSMHGIHFNELVRLRKDVVLEDYQEVLDAGEEMKILGFTDENEVVIAIDGVDFIRMNIEEFNKKFEMIRTYYAYNSETKEPGDELELLEDVRMVEEVRVGNKYRLREGHTTHVLDIETPGETVYEVVGFSTTERGKGQRPVLQIDGGSAKKVRISHLKNVDDYELIEKGPHPEQGKMDGMVDDVKGMEDILFQD